MHSCKFKMIFVICLFIFLQLMVSLCFCKLLQQQPLCHDHERTFLLQFNESFIIDNSSSGAPLAYPITTHWRPQPQEESDCCLWDGVECEEDSGHVISLDLNSSCLHGSINSSNSLFKLTQLRRLNLADNDFNYSGIPTNMNNLSRLTYLNLSASHFSGLLPYSLGNLTHLTQLILSTNKFFGPIPPSFARLKHLEVLLLSYNFLTGTVNFNTFLGLKNLSVIKLDFNNNLSVNIGPSNRNTTLSQFSAIGLRSCNLRKIPQICTNKCRLRLITFSNNRLHGQIPRSLSNCGMLESLNLGNNKLNDVFPFWLGNLPKLRILLLRSNDFHGIINEPKSNFEFPELRIVDLSCNNFTGMLPFKYMQSWTAMKNNSLNHSTYLMLIKWSSTVTRYINLRFGMGYAYSIIITNKGLETKYDRVQEILAIIDMSSNKFEGRILEIIGNLKGLHSLNLSSNMLTGNIPSSLGNLTELESLDLSQNKLSGYIPQQLAQLTYLSFFNVSHNNLIGPIPQGKQFDTFDNSSYMGNSGLCGDPITERCLNSRTPQVPSLDEEDHDSGSQFKFGWKPVVIGYGAGLVIGLLIGHVLISKKRRWLSLIFRVKNFETKGRTNGCN